MPTLREQLLGTWRLVSYRTEGTDGSVVHPMGEHAIGYIMYLPDGYMSANLMVPGRAPYTGGTANTATQAELAAGALGYFGYAGRYEVDEAPDPIGVPHGEGSANVPPAVGRTQSNLRRGSVAPRQDERIDRLSAEAPKGSSQGYRLIETAPPQPISVQWNRNDHVVVQWQRGRLDQERRQCCRHRHIAAVLASRQHLDHRVPVPAREHHPRPRSAESRLMPVTVLAEVVCSPALEWQPAHRAHR